MILELVDHGEATSTPVADYGRGNGNPSTQNGLQESPDEVPPPPASLCVPDIPKRLHAMIHHAKAPNSMQTHATHTMAMSGTLQ